MLEAQHKLVLRLFPKGSADLFCRKTQRSGLYGEMLAIISHLQLHCSRYSVHTCILHFIFAFLLFWVIKPLSLAESYVPR